MDFNDSIVSMNAQLGTNRDKASGLEYTNTRFGPEQAETAYRNSWLARRIIDKRADDSTRKWREWLGLSPEQVSAVEALEKRHQIKAKVNRALKLASLHGGSALYFDTGQSPEEPLALVDARDALQFVTVLTRQDLNPGDIENDPLERGYGKPKWYELTTGGGVSRRIHPSRLAIFLGEQTEGLTLAADNMGWGDSRLRPVFDAIKQFEGTVANVASLVFEAKVDVFGVSGLSALVKDDPGPMVRRYSTLAMLKGNNGMIVMDKDDESYEQKSASFGGLPEIMGRFEQIVSGAADMPRAVLFGTASGGLGSSGDLELSAYYDSVGSEQENDIGPAMENLDEVMLRSALGQRPKDAFYNWRSLWQMSDKERAELGEMQSRTVKTLWETGLFDPESLGGSAIAMFDEAGTITGLSQGLEEGL